MAKNLLLSTLLSLKAHKLRVFLTMVGIIIGIAAVVTVSAIGEGMKESSLRVLDSTDATTIRLVYKEHNQSNDASPKMEESSFSFNRDDLKILRQLKNIDSLTADYGFGFGSNESISATMNYFNGENTSEIIPYKGPFNGPVFGKVFESSDMDQNKIIITYETMSNILKIKEPRDVIGRAIDVDGLMFQVIGVKDHADPAKMIADNRIFYNEVPKKAFNELAISKPINAIKIKILPESNREAIIKEANKLLQSYHPDLTGGFEEDRSNEQMRKEVEGMLQAIVTGLLLITAISLLVGGIGVMNIMYVSVSERKREIGIRRAIGARPSNILLQFLLEAAFITLLGGIIGILFGWGIATIVSSLSDNIQAIVSPKMALMSASISAGIGLFFGVIPAINAAKLDPIKAIYQ